MVINKRYGENAGNDGSKEREKKKRKNDGDWWKGNGARSLAESLESLMALIGWSVLSCRFVSGWYYRLEKTIFVVVLNILLYSVMRSQNFKLIC